MRLTTQSPEVSGKLSHWEKSQVISFEEKKVFIRNIMKVLKAIDKYMLLKVTSPKNSEVKEKIAMKMPLLDKALSKLKDKRATLVFTDDRGRFSSDGKGEFTKGLRSTMNEHSTIDHIILSTPSNKYNPNADCSGIQDSFTRSVKTLFNSIKTQSISTQSDAKTANDMKIRTLIKDSNFVDDKMAEIELKVTELKAYLQNSK